MKPLCSPAYATCCSVLSVAGILFLGIFGIVFDVGLEVVTESTKYPADNAAVARSCYIGAAIYVLTLMLSACQLLVHKRSQRVAYSPVATH